eukprot:1487971-Pyramimonas_sp.AAC.1
MYWQDWSPTESNVPRSLLNTRPLKIPLAPEKFPAVQDGSGDGARGDARAEFFPWQDIFVFLATASPLLSGNAPEGGTPSI